MASVRLIRWTVIAAGLGWAGAAWAQDPKPDAPSKPGASERLARMEELSRELARSYLKIWSSNDRAALEDVEQVYGPLVVFYGQTLQQKDLAAQKRSFLRRWPRRSYALRPNSMRVRCSLGAEGCIVNAVIDWEVGAPARREVSRGTSSFELGIDFSGPQPAVSSEGGRVLRRS